MSREIMKGLVKKIFCEILKKHNYSYESFMIYDNYRKRWVRDLKVVCKICGKALK
jgi:glycyl-tRNA synthetase beta subunit